MATHSVLYPVNISKTVSVMSPEISSIVRPSKNGSFINSSIVS